MSDVANAGSVLSRSLPGPVNKIVVVRASQIGDFLVAVPALRALRHAFPLASISYIGLPHLHPIVKRFPQYVDRFLEFPGFPGIREWAPDPRRIVGFLAEAQGEGYDLAIQMQASGVFTNPFTKLLGARLSAGFVRQEDSAFFLGLDYSLPYRPGRHQILRMLDLLGEMGIEQQGTEMEFPLTEADYQELEGVLLDAGLGGGEPLLGVHPGARFADRRWAPERFGAAARELGGMLGAKVVVTGTEGEHEVTGVVVEALGDMGVDLTGRLSLGGMGALLSRLRLLLVNDTGVAHLAYALGTPSVTVFGSASPDEWGPLDCDRHKGVSACDPGRPVGHNSLHRIQVETVLSQARLLVA